MNCNECRNINIDPCDRFQAEGAIHVLRQQFKFVWAVVILLIITNLVTIVHYKNKFSQYEQVQQEVIQEAEGGENFFIGGDNYGTAGN